MYYNSFFPYNNSRNPALLKKGLSLFSLKSINWSNVLNNTQKTLNVINQAIPVYYQVKPIWGNAKTMFRMIGALKDNNNNNNNSSNISKSSESNSQKKNPETIGPVFFL